MANGKLVKERIRAALIDLEIPSQIAEDIAFHMTDWEEDLHTITELYQREAELSNDEVQNMVMDFLIHVPNHVAAAKKLIGLGPIEDVFKVGVLEEDED